MNTNIQALMVFRTTALFGAGQDSVYVTFVLLGWPLDITGCFLQLLYEAGTLRQNEHKALQTAMSDSFIMESNNNRAVMYLLAFRPTLLIHHTNHKLSTRLVILVRGLWENIRACQDDNHWSIGHWEIVTTCHQLGVTYWEWGYPLWDNFEVWNGP